MVDKQSVGYAPRSTQQGWSPMFRAVLHAGSALLGGSLFPSAEKVTKNACPRHPAPPAAGFPHSIVVPEAGVQGPSWPYTPLAASMRLSLFHNDSVRPPEGGGTLPESPSRAWDAERGRVDDAFLIHYFGAPDRSGCLSPRRMGHGEQTERCPPYALPTASDAQATSSNPLTEGRAQVLRRR